MHLIDSTESARCDALENPLHQFATYDPDDKLSIATNQLVSGRWLPSPDDDICYFDLVILDEAHHGQAQTWRKSIECFERTNSRIIMLTATPEPLVKQQKTGG